MRSICAKKGHITKIDISYQQLVPKLDASLKPKTFLLSIPLPPHRPFPPHSNPIPRPAPTLYRQFLLSVESELFEFMAEPSAQSKTFPPLNPYFRRLFHLTCRRFGIDSSSSAAALWGLDEGTVLTKSSSSCTPLLSFSDLMPTTPSPDDKVYAVPPVPPVHTEALRRRIREQTKVRSFHDV